MNYLDIARAAYPNATEEYCNYILWERTPFPMRRVPAREFYRKVCQDRRAVKNNVRLCEMCDNRLEFNNRFTCKKCTANLARYSQ